MRDDVKRTLADCTESALDREIAEADTQPQHCFSAAHEQKIRTLFRSPIPVRRTVHAGWRAACIVLAAALLCGAAWYTEPVSGFLRKTLGNQPVISVESDTDAPETIMQYYLPETLPTGYSLQFSNRWARYAMTSYLGNGTQLILFQFVKSEYRDVLLDDSSTAKYETDETGRRYLVFSAENRAGYSVVWEQSDYVFLLNVTDDLPKAAAFSLCRSLKAAE